MMVRAGQDGEDERLVDRLMKRVGMALARQEKRGAVRASREAGQFVLWEKTR